MDTRRSRVTLDSKKTSTKEGGSQSIVLKRGNIGTTSTVFRAEAASSRAESKVVEDTDDSSAESKTSARVLRSKGKNVGKEDISQTTPNETVESEADESEADESEAESKVDESEAIESEMVESEPVSLNQSKDGKSPSASPPPKRRRRMKESQYVIEEPQCIVVSDEDSLSAEEENSFTKDPLSPDTVLPTNASSSSSSTAGGSQKPSDDKRPPSSLNAMNIIRTQGVSKPVTSTMKRDSLIKPITIQVKKVVRGATDGEIQVVTSYEGEVGSIFPATYSEKVKKHMRTSLEKVRSESSQGNKSSEKIDGESGMKGQASSPEKAHRTYPGPVKKMNTITKTGGRKYMILDKATIKGMMEKGLIQAIGKEGGKHNSVAYRAILPKAGPSILHKIATPAVKQNSGGPNKSAVKSILQDTNDTAQSASPVKQNTSVLSSSTSVSTSSITEIPSGSIRIQVPRSLGSSKVPVSSVQQVITAPVFVKSQASGSNSNPGDMQVVNLPPTILNQIQQSLLSISANNSNPSMKSILHTVPSKTDFKGNAVLSSTGKLSTEVNLIEDIDDPEYMPDVDLSSDLSDDDGSKGKYGIPTGVCKVLKSMKMYQYIDKPSAKEPSIQQSNKVPKPGNGKNIRWVAVPNNPGEPKPDGGPKLQRCTPPILPINVPTIAKEIEDMSNPALDKSRHGLRRSLKDMKLQHARLIGKHRTRFSRLQKKYFELERDYKEVEDVGTPNQIVRDAKKFLSDEHALFMESQMFLKNCEGKGNRFSKRFMKLMMDLYSKSPAGYRYLKTIFTIPSIKTIEKLQSRGFSGRNKTPDKDPLEVNTDDSVPATEDSSSRSVDNHHPESILEPQSRNVNVKSEMLAGGDALSLPLENNKTLTMDNKDWFKSGMMLSESLPSTSGQTVFLSGNVKESLLQERRTSEDDEDSSSHLSKSDNSELSEVGEITSFDDIAKKVVVVPDNQSPSKQEITIQWDESWGPI